MVQSDDRPTFDRHTEHTKHLKHKVLETDVAYWYVLLPTPQSNFSITFSLIAMHYYVMESNCNYFLLEPSKSHFTSVSDKFFKKAVMLVQEILCLGCPNAH